VTTLPFTFTDYGRGTESFQKENQDVQVIFMFCIYMPTSLQQKSDAVQGIGRVHQSAFSTNTAPTARVYAT
jgi:hypothetical protein